MAETAWWTKDDLDRLYNDFVIIHRSTQWRFKRELNANVLYNFKNDKRIAIKASIEGKETEKFVVVIPTYENIKNKKYEGRELFGLRPEDIDLNYLKRLMKDLEDNKDLKTL